MGNLEASFKNNFESKAAKNNHGYNFEIPSCSFIRRKRSLLSAFKLKQPTLDGSLGIHYQNVYFTMNQHYMDRIKCYFRFFNRDLWVFFTLLCIPPPPSF